MDENKYCKIGGYSNYKGLTVDEIANGISDDNKNRINLSRYIEDFKDSGIMGIVLPIGIALMGFIIYGMIINSLYKKMYSKSTILAYIPITNVFITFQLAFGKIVAIIGLLLYVIGVVFILIDINIMFYIVCGLVGIAFIVDLLKLITKKYDMFYLEPSIKTNVITEEVNTSVEEEPNTQEALDLSYGNADDVSLSNLEENNSFNVSSGEVSNTNTSSNTLDETDINEGINNNYTEKDDDDDDGESDLANFFR